MAYSALILEERWYPMEDAVAGLLRVLREAAAPDEPVHALDVLDTAREPYTGWREAAFEASLGRGYVRDGRPVVAKGLRPYPSVALAVNDRLWRERGGPRSSFSLNLGKLRVLVPDTRARIRKAAWAGSTLSVQSERNAAPEDVELQAVIVDRRTSTVLESRRVEPEVEWEIPPEADAVEVYLIHRDGTLLSQRRLTWGEHFRARPGDFVLQEVAEKELRQGEGERVEYKSFIEPKNAKEQEVIKAVVAFSNSHGGRIYVGVEDDGTPQDEAELRKAGKGTAEQALAALVRQATRLVRERIKPVPDADVAAVHVFGRSILVVNVRPGEDAPYSTTENDVYIRKGASNRKPDPRTELPSIIQLARERAERRARQERLDALGASSWVDD